MDWQPIETAPKDETRILVTCVGKEPVIGWWASEQSYEQGHWRTEDEGSPDFMWGPIEPTHWMLLPVPPS